MPAPILKIKLINYRRFRDYSIEPNDKVKILIGDNAQLNVLAKGLALTAA
ncbi:MAG: hypothetical protein M0T74_06860 [Desulfitobacterium hafniense]|nr:hypothetical protein [Desulfosporosinus sp.]MDA8227414.1 hypothetical protein [Desulfitobacterium hafniense]